MMTLKQAYADQLLGRSFTCFTRGRPFRATLSHGECSAFLADLMACRNVEMECMR